ncbi:biopolymer transporter ExbD [Caulobacter sp. 17J65-9]|uniref:biopolymer transporter ExbD n=1 Tax=Caulobacter sp. 17J65-9 TaxID=2709382 RepID=UPI0013CD42E2|nr:biopolymer transporter ExbD [Caulobacter sp. 17J65-9]NEX92334.1 biopolymer transporter ExbD [Caulobacter sp. 17J65-9]
MGAKLSGGGDSKYTVATNADLNVTPLVDVMLVLLIIFMVAAPLATVSIKLDMPPATPPVGKVEPPVFISIQENGDLFIGRGEEMNQKTSLDTLAGDLAGRLGGDNPTEEQVFVRAQADVQYGQFMEVLNDLQDNGFFKVGLINEDIS